MDNDARMTKRVLATFLWFYVSWYAGALVADFIHVSPVLGPIMGIAAGVLIAMDPGRIIWTKQDKTQTQSRLNPEPN